MIRSGVNFELTCNWDAVGAAYIDINIIGLQTNRFDNWLTVFDGDKTGHSPGVGALLPRPLVGLAPQSQGIVGVQSRHERQATVLVGDLVDLTDPVVDHRLRGIVPGVVEFIEQQ